MTTEDALEFLRSHQPMPPTDELTEDTLRRLDQVRAHFKRERDLRAIPLLLNVFGEGDGHGVYAMIETTIATYSSGDVVPHIKDALSSSYGSVRSWCAEIACSFPDASYVPLLEKMIGSGDDDERGAASECLAVIKMRLN